MVRVRCAFGGTGWTCQVAVDHLGERTSHTVLVSATDLDRYVGAGRGERENVEDLVGRSFEFLLQREPPRSILRRFDLSVINTYFPEYDQLFKR